MEVPPSYGHWGRGVQGEIGVWERGEGNLSRGNSLIRSREHTAFQWNWTFFLKDSIISEIIQLTDTKSGPWAR